MNQENSLWWVPYNSFFKAKPIEPTDKWDFLRKRAEKCSDKAKLRLEWMIFYHTVGQESASKTAKHFGVSRKTFHKWLNRFDEKRLETLEDQSRAPKRKRQKEITRQQELRIIDLRKKKMMYGKVKLQKRYREVYGEEISTWKIEETIRKYNLFPDKKKHAKRLKKARRSQTKRRIQDVESSGNFGHLWHVDCIIIYWYGLRRVVFTAIEELTKIGYARAYKTNTSGYAEDFLKRLMYLVEGKVELMHSDNGSEFAGKFNEACQQLGIEQVYSRVRTPKDNAALERYNRTVREEWLDYSEVGLDEIDEANVDLTEWLVEYNAYRYHQSLSYMTPLDYAQENFFKDVLPMYSASTPT